MYSSIFFSTNDHSLKLTFCYNKLNNNPNIQLPQSHKHPLNLFKYTIIKDKHMQIKQINLSHQEPNKSAWCVNNNKYVNWHEIYKLENLNKLWMMNFNIKSAWMREKKKVLNLLRSNCSLNKQIINVWWFFPLLYFSSSSFCSFGILMNDLFMYSVGLSCYFLSYFWHWNCCLVWMVEEIWN